MQVVLALLVTPDGIPCGYRVFPGNIWEGRTLIDAMAALRARHPASRFTVVADAGLPDSETCKTLAEAGIPYILGARLKSASAEMKVKILDPEGFESWPPSPDDDGQPSQYKELRDGDRRLIVTWSAKRDAENRDKTLDRLCARLNNGETLSAVVQRRHAGILRLQGTAAIDPGKVADAARWDGLGGGVAHGLDDAEARGLVRQYRGLWQIEACFRANKHDLKIRPVFHWVPRRIRAHIAICYMAFC